MDPSLMAGLSLGNVWIVPHRFAHWSVRVTLIPKVVLYRMSELLVAVEDE